ncbi:MAG: TlpA family protein disulfide reductase [Chitinophagaceae bacterium]
MKKVFMAFLATGMLLPTFAQQKPATVNGAISRKSKEPVKLFTITHGRIEEIASSKVDEQGKFGFLFYPEKEAFYVIGLGNPQVASDKFSFYFKPGDQLNFEINDTSYALVGKNTAENKAIATWHDKAYVVEVPSLYLNRMRDTYKQFFPKFEAFQKDFAQSKAVKTGNKQFDAAFAIRQELDVLFYASSFVFMPNTMHPTSNDYIAYYKNLDVAKYTADGRLLRYPFGMRMLSSIQRLPAMANGWPMEANDPDKRIALMQNDTLKGEVFIESARYLKTYLGYMDLAKKYEKYILTEDQKARLSEISTKLAQADSKPGQPAINFSYPDINGKMTSLTDFKGKVVLVDVWATWCGPCKAEIPHLKKMEEDMRNQDVVFMSVSVDEQKDFQKWKDFVAKEELKGVQMFAAGWSDIAKNYNIKGIPRFMVFDKKGNIVTIDSPRPSSKELKLLLENELKK